MIITQTTFRDVNELLLLLLLLLHLLLFSSLMNHGRLCLAGLFPFLKKDLSPPIFFVFPRSLLPLGFYFRAGYGGPAFLLLSTYFTQ